MTKQRSPVLNTVTPLYKERRAARQSPGELALSHPQSRKYAMEAMCWECLGSGDDAGWKWGIGNCTSPQCSLFTLRPYQHKLGQPEEGVYIRGDK